MKTDSTFMKTYENAFKESIIMLANYEKFIDEAFERGMKKAKQIELEFLKTLPTQAGTASKYQREN